MRWPWKAEKRESNPYTDAIVSRIVEAAGGLSSGDPSAIAAFEVACGLYSRAFASAKITPQNNRTMAITPSVAAAIGRGLIRSGESLHLIEVIEGTIRLVPIGHWDITGGDDPRTWYVRASIFGPSETREVVRPWNAFLHVRYAVDPASPWRGIGPLGWASDTGILAGNLEKRLGEEAGGPVAHLLPVPSAGEGEGDGESDPNTLLRADIKAGKGRTLLIETTTQGWGQGAPAAPRRDLVPSRLGADPPATLASLRTDAALSVLGACGVPPSLAASVSGDGTAQRESWRRFLHGSVQPLAAITSQELSEKLEVPITFDFSKLMASDIMGRARSVGSLVKSGMDLSDALALTLLDES